MPIIARTAHVVQQLLPCTSLPRCRCSVDGAGRKAYVRVEIVGQPPRPVARVTRGVAVLAKRDEIAARQALCADPAPGAFGGFGPAQAAVYLDASENSSILSKPMGSVIILTTPCVNLYRQSNKSSRQLSDFLRSSCTNPILVRTRSGQSSYIVNYRGRGGIIPSSRRTQACLAVPRRTPSRYRGRPPATPTSPADR